MRLVEDGDVPREPLERADHFRPLDEINRRDNERLERPRVDAGRQPGGCARDAVRIEDDRGQREAAGELAAPLFPQPRRADDKDSGVGVARQGFGNHQPRFDGLAEPHGVGDQESATVAVQKREHRLELKRNEVQFRV